MNQESSFKSHGPTWMIMIAMMITPLGVAGQNIGLGIALGMFVYWSILDQGRSFKSAIKTPYFKEFLILWALIIIPIVLATIARGSFKDAQRFFWGYSLKISLVIAALSFRSISINRTRLLNTATFSMIFIALIALSQMTLGWKLDEGEIAHQIKRAQGFYSHPLTLAYASLVLMPWCIARLLAKPKQWQSWGLGLSMAILLFSSQSITVLVVTVLAFAFLCYKILSKKSLLQIMSLGVLICGLVAVTPNPISQKWTVISSGQRGDHETPYPDDRIAFWHANFEMFKDAPYLGHGSGLEAEDRQPYYEKIGLGYLKRMYESHNMFLEYAVEGGIVSLVALIAFLSWWHIRAKQLVQSSNWHRIALYSTPLFFALGGLTQNSIQDSEVRYTVILFLSATLWFTRSPTSNHLN